jgi:hypothetical protein
MRKDGEEEYGSACAVEWRAADGLNCLGESWEALDSHDPHHSPIIGPL